jgi:serine/threonine-protein kinase
MTGGREVPDETSQESGGAVSADESSSAKTVDEHTRTSLASADRAPKKVTRRRLGRPLPESIGSYRIVSKLGEGGMGVVYEAEQRHPRRRVALKVVRGGRYIDSQFLKMFQREADTLARLKHPNIAAIYEAGRTEDGQHFFAMELVPGTTLRRYLNARSSTVTPEELVHRLRVFRKIADAVHYAHQRGVIHRDLKPTNVIVNELPDAEDTHASYAGGPEVKILDFGLARITDPEVAPVTVTTDVGEIKGTLPYMSPEQARGEELDTRADVYALGVMLYELLSRQRPYDTQRTSLVDAVRVISEQTPRPLSQAFRGSRKLDPDVETIVGKALEKEADRRYASAAALSEDIERYLTRQPILARPPSAVYQVRKLVSRHREAAAASGVALLLLVAALGWGGYTRWTAGQRARLAQTFGQEIERIESMARYAHTIPLHDIRPELAAIRAQMERTERRIGEVGRSAVGPGHYALGRGHMVMKDYGAAREHLERAWDAGYRPPELAYALGRVLGVQYTEALHDADRIRDEGRREARKREIDRAYREPALDYLRQSADAETASPEYLAALLAFYETRHDEALEQARAAHARLPWMYEAMQLEGDIHLTVAGRERHRGELQAAMERYEASERAYRAAIEVGESDPDTHTALCGLGWSRMIMEINDWGADTEDFFALGIDACEKALTANPEHADALAFEAGLYGRLAEYRRATGGESLAPLGQALQAARAALEIRPGDARTYGYLAKAYRQQADHESDRGEDPTASLDLAIGAFERALEIEPADSNLLNGLGVAYKNKGNYLNTRGEDPKPSWERAAAVYVQAIELDPRGTSTRVNLASVYHRLALHESDYGGDPSRFLDQEVRTLEDALELNPGRPVVMYQLARALKTRAATTASAGGDPTPDLFEAAEVQRRAIEVNPDSPHAAHFFNVLGGVLSDLARYQRSVGQDPESSFSEASAAFRESIRHNPRLVYPWDNWSALCVQSAEHRLDRGADPRPLLREAVDHANAALELKPDYVFALGDLADAHRVRMRYTIEHGGDPSGALERGLSAAAKALAINPDSAATLTLIGRLHAQDVRGRVERRVNGDAAFEASRRAFDRALELDGDNLSALHGLAELHRWRAQGLAPESAERAAALERGLELLGKALGHNARMAEAIALRGELLHLQVPLAGTAERRSELLAQARDSLRAALDINAHLGRRYEPPLAAIEESLRATSQAAR